MQPQVTRTYQNHHLDSTRWEIYRPREGDIIVTTSYKSGTTWTQQILHQLLHGHEDPVPDMRELSPWVDARFMGTTKEQMGEMLEGISSRRFIKSHLPLDGLPYHAEAQYLIVARDTRDVFMSLLNHYSSYTDIAMAAIPAALPARAVSPACLKTQVPGWGMYSIVAAGRSVWTVDMI